MQSFVNAGGILRCHECASARKKARKLERERERRQEFKAADDERYANLCERENQKCHRRRVKIAKAPSDLTTADVLRLKRSAKACAMCGGPLPRRITSRPLDHIVPLHANGTHTRDNVRVLCISCNSARPKDASDVSNFQLNIWMVQDAA